MLTARAVTSTTSTNDDSDCIDIRSLATPVMGSVSVGLKAVAFVRRRVQVVREGGLPAGHDVLAVGHLREQEVRRVAAVGLALARAAAVELPVHECEHQQVGDPYSQRAGEQLPPAHLGALGDQLVHEEGERRAVGRDREGEERERERPLPRLLAAQRIGDRQRQHSEHRDDREDHAGPE